MVGGYATIGYNEGDGNDLIYGFGDWGGYLKIGDGNGSYSATTSNDNKDVIITVGDGKITLVGAGQYDIELLNIEGHCVDRYIKRLTESVDKYNNTLSGATILALGGNDSIYNDKINVSINGGTGKDTLVNTGRAGTLEGGAGDDLIKLMYLTSDNVIIYNADDGNDIVEGFSESDTLLIRGTTPSTRIIDNDIVVRAGTGRITLAGAANLGKVNIAEDKNPLLVEGTEADDELKNLLNDATVLAYGGDDTVDNWGDNVIIDGGSGNDSIYSDGYDVTISGGADNDKIINVGGANVLFVYENGNDSISGFNGTSTLQIGDGNGSYSATTSSDNKDVIITVGDGKITLVGAATLKTLNIAGKKVASTLQVITDKDAAKVTVDAAVITADASSRTSAIYLVGNALDNSILGGSGKDSLYGKDGDDYLFGGAGADSIYGQNGDDTLWGGTGNDTLKGGSGTDTFIYNSGEGKDVIVDFSEDDLLKISGDWTATCTSSAKTIAFKVGSTSNAITLQNVMASGTFNINGNVYKISGSKLVKK